MMLCTLISVLFLLASILNLKALQSTTSANDDTTSRNTDNAIMIGILQAHLAVSAIVATCLWFMQILARLNLGNPFFFLFSMAGGAGVSSIMFDAFMLTDIAIALWVGSSWFDLLYTAIVGFIISTRIIQRYNQFPYQMLVTMSIFAVLVGIYFRSVRVALDVVVVCMNDLLIMSFNLSDNGNGNGNANGLFALYKSYLKQACLVVYGVYFVKLNYYFVFKVMAPHGYLKLASTVTGAGVAVGNVVVRYFLAN